MSGKIYRQQLCPRLSFVAPAVIPDPGSWFDCVVLGAVYVPK